MRITKQIAQDAAQRMCAEAEEKVSTLEARYEDAVFECVKASVPDKVMEVYQKKPFRQWLSLAEYVYLHGEGLSSEYSTLKEALPVKNGSSAFTVNNFDAPNIVKLLNEYKDAEKKLKKLQLNISSTLVGLKTLKNVEKNFPEALPYLQTPDANTVTTVAIPVENIMAELKTFLQTAPKNEK